MRVIKLLLLSLLLPFGCDLDFTYQKPRRVFTRRFVALCVVVAVFELLILNAIYNK
ncbi:hypothetical protein SAMN04490179_3874 [Pseudomonas antarctica]|uniref:Uncharacterized protein n=1 Tax=Pseudomonas antarctica TaxID=219572 RepID=A0A1H0AT99_9PSED|nr:hypothetical protein [Pseudomonas antarctica]KAF2407491.1 hypothetical protein PSAN_44200 [Pseudomonas antarctica]SDN36677.1 hypothetical protein SAMN04490179_3874 [Pseudomonas antarctica]